MKKRLLALLLALVLLVGTLPLVGATPGTNVGNPDDWNQAPDWFSLDVNARQIPASDNQLDDYWGSPIEGMTFSFYVDGRRVLQATANEWGSAFWTESQTFLENVREITIRATHPRGYLPLFAGATDDMAGNVIAHTIKADGTITIHPDTLRRLQDPYVRIFWEFYPTATTPATLPDTPFTDVDTDLRVTTAVRSMYRRGIMNGTSDTTFEPNTPLDRAMFATLLHRHAGSFPWGAPPQLPPTTFRPVFSDVSDGRWYTNGIMWASDNGIVHGIGDGRFLPTGVLSRQEMAVMLHRYFVQYWEDFYADWGWNFDYFYHQHIAVPSHVQAPAGTAPWATDAMRWAVYHGILHVSNNPTSPATRGEAAVAVSNLFHNAII